MKRNTTIRRPAVISMLHVVERLEVKRDQLNPLLVPLRKADQNLDELREWRNSSKTLRGSLPVQSAPVQSAPELPSAFKAPELYTEMERVAVLALRGVK